jgi:hypothetical protein
MGEMAEYITFSWHEPTPEEERTLREAAQESARNRWEEYIALSWRGPNRPFSDLVIDTVAWQRQLDILNLAGDVWDGD